MTKKRGLAKTFLTSAFLFVFIALGILFPRQARALSLQQVYTPITSFLTVVSEKVQYIFAFTPADKVKVLEIQAQRRLTLAQNNSDKAEGSIKEYQDIKNKQKSLLNEVDDNTLKQIQDQTVEEQRILAEIGNSTPVIGNTIKTVNTNVVEGVKNVVTLKEGTTAGEAFNQKATIIYAPGTSGGGAGGQTIQGGGQQFAPGTSGGGTGTTTVEGNNPGFAPGTSSGGSGGTTVEGNNPGTAPGTSGGGTSGQTVVGE